SGRRNYQSLVVSLNLANALLQSGDVAQARALVTRYLEFSRTVPWDGFNASVPVFALLATAEGRCRGAARLLGYAQRFVRSARLPHEPNEARAYEIAIARVRAALGARQCRSQMSQGERMDQDAVSALALQTRDIDPPA
ncbi:MAG TPA: hypothetical protein VFP36_03875, partial [Usitatibacter sp.]|nr:hypothetical protein [Usitatibacter sp.]